MGYGCVTIHNTINTIYMSHVKNAEAFGKLIGICTGYAGGYNPGSSNLQITSMQAMLNETRQALIEVYSAQTLFDNATNNREVVFKEMRLRCTRIYNVLKACSASALTLEDARARIRKMNGYRTQADIQTVTEAIEAPAKKKRNPSGTDYISLTEHYARLLETVSAEAKYKSYEADLTMEALSQLLDSLRASNDEVWQAVVQLANARNHRNGLMYQMQSNLYNTAMAAKAYVKGAFGFSSSQYKEVSKIRFTKS